MGAISGLLGTAGGINGTGMNGPADAYTERGVTQGQVGTAYTGNQNALAGQGALLDALKGQNGLANQSQVYNQGQNLAGQLGGLNSVGAQGAAMGQQGALNQGLTGLNAPGAMGAAMNQQGALAGQLGGAGGIGAQTGAIGGLQNVLAAQQGTAGQLQGIANGTGPNPAQAALNQSTGQNIAAQAALMAGQRGAGSNVGLLARQVAQQGAATQQQAVGQGATMQAQQQLAAINAMTGQQQAMAGTNQALAGVGSNLTAQQQAALAQQYGQGAGAVGQLQSGIGQQFGQGATGVGQQQSQQGLNAGIAQNQAANQIGATGANTQAQQAEQGQLLSAQGAANSASVGNQGNINSTNAALANSNMQGQQALIGGAMNSIGSMGGMMGGKAKGGLISRYEDGGEVEEQPELSHSSEPVAPAAENPTAPTAQSSFGQFLNGYNATAANSQQGLANIGNVQNGSAALEKGMSSMMKSGSDLKNSISGLFDSGGGGDSTDSGMGGMASIAAMAAKGGQATHDYRGGGNVKAKNAKEKAVKSGNSYSNDKIPAVLSEGEVVIPRSVMQGKDPTRGAADFVSKVLAKRGRK